MSTPVAGRLCRDVWCIARWGACAVAPVALSGCMTLGGYEPPPGPPPEAVTSAPLPEIAVPKSVPKPVARKPPRPPHPEVARRQPAPVDLKHLIGLNRAAVRRILGTPHRVQTDHLSLSWVYEAPGCSVRVIFYPSLDNASFHVLKFAGFGGDGAPLDMSDACVSRILVARNNAH